MANFAWFVMGKVKSMFTVLHKIPPKITHTPNFEFAMQELSVQLFQYLVWFHFWIGKILYYSLFPLEIVELFLWNLL